MVNPVLKKLRSGVLSSADTAALLQKHVGPCSNQYHCGEALEAIESGRNQQARSALRVIRLLLTGEKSSCELALALIMQLRSGAQD